MKTKRYFSAFLLVVACCLMPTLLCAQPTYIFSNSIGSRNTEKAQSMAVDGSGNVYIIGSFTDTADFDPGVGTANLVPAGSGTFDIFVAKYTSAGAYLWAFKIGNFSNDKGFGIAVDNSSGNVTITGFFGGTVDFDPGATTNNLVSGGSADIFVAQYTAVGTYLWAFNAGSTSSGEQGSNVALDGSGNVYVTGTFKGTADFDPGTGTANLTSAGGVGEIFLAKYDSNGAYLWAFRIGSIGDDKAYGIAVDSIGNVFITGHFQSTVDFDPGVGTANYSAPGSIGMFAAKYSSTGDYIWAVGISSTFGDIGFDIIEDGTGNVYIAGYFSGTADFDSGAGTANLTSAGATDAFIVKYSSIGSYLWALGLGSTSADQCASITLDMNGNIYTTGFFQGIVDFDPGVGTANLTSAGTSDIFIAQYTSAGAFICAGNMGGNNSDEGLDIVVDDFGDTYLIGSFSSSSADFDPGAGTVNLTSAGSDDIFFSKYGLCNPVTVEAIDNHSKQSIIFPNPANNELNFQFSNQDEEEINIEVYDVAGKLIISKSFSVSDGNNLYSIDISSIPNGMYMLNMKTKSTLVNQKFIKQ